MAHQLPRSEPRRRPRLDDLVCVVTGSSRGIGRGIAEEFGRHGAEVVVNYRSTAAKADEVVEGIENSGGSAMAIQTDVGDGDQVETMRDRVHEAFGAVDVLVNNAGVTVDRTFEDMEREDWDRVIDVNLGGAFNCTKAFYDDLKYADRGRLINISSVVGKRGNYGQTNYATTKSGLFGFTRSLAHELAPHGTTANCIAPGYTRTDMVDEVRAEIKQELRDRIPLGRFANVDEVACVARFLASEESTYITGAVIDVNGGMTP